MSKADVGEIIKFCETGGEVGVAASHIFDLVDEISKLPNSREALGVLVEGLAHATDHPECFPAKIQAMAKTDLKKVIMALICIDFFPHLEDARYSDVSEAMSAAMDSLNRSMGSVDHNSLMRKPSDVIH